MSQLRWVWLAARSKSAAGRTDGPSKLHYRHLDFYIPETRATRVTDTYVFLPTKFELPATAMADQTTMALEELTAALNDRALDTILVNNNNNLNRRLQQIRTILTPRPAPVPAPAAAAPRVARRHALPPRVNKHHEPAPRVLRPRVPVYAQTSTRGTQVYKMFDGPRERSVCHQECFMLVVEACHRGPHHLLTGFHPHLSCALGRRSTLL